MSGLTCSPDSSSDSWTQFQEDSQLFSIQMTDRNEPKLIEEVVYDSSDAEFDDDEETISIPAATKVVSSRKNDDLPNTSLENGQYNTNVIVLLERVKVPNSQGLE